MWNGPQPHRRRQTPRTLGGVELRSWGKNLTQRREGAELGRDPHAKARRRKVGERTSRKGASYGVGRGSLTNFAKLYGNEKPLCATLPCVERPLKDVAKGHRESC